MNTENISKPRVALVTCRELPDLSHDARLVVAPLADREVEAVPAIWDDETVDWDSFDLAVIRSCWDYVPRLDEFIRWAHSVPRLANPADVIEWNTNKKYLIDLENAGVGIVPTTWLKPGDDWQAGHIGKCVVKPAVSMSSLDTGSYRLDDTGERDLAMHHVQRLLDDGREVMIQPYMSAIDSEGETSLVFLGGAYSHATKKHAILTGPETGSDHRLDEVSGLEPKDEATPEQLTVAEKALENVPGGPERLLYARVDMVSTADGIPVLMELELTEPQLFLAFNDFSAGVFADAIVERAGLLTG